jgi:deoxyadenosine/deoxycytidine kinase
MSLNAESFDVADNENLFIAVAGLIGAGKSTLAESLSEIMGIPVFNEPVVNNVYLEDFYKNQEKFSFKMQIFLLSKRLKQQHQLISNGKGGVMDRSIYEDLVFARTLRDSGYMDERDYDLYKELFNLTTQNLARPHLIVFLDVTPEQAMERIKTRSRSAESLISIEYLRELHKVYQTFIENLSKRMPVIRVDWSEFGDSLEMAKSIQLTWKEMSNIHDVIVPSNGKK